MLYYPYKTMFSVYKSVIGSPCACDLFVSKVTKITRYMDVRFWRSFFGAFSVCDDCILKSTKAWLLKLSVLYIHSFMQVHNTTFKIKTVFNNVLFSTEVHNPLHAHLLALSHIYIYTYILLLLKKQVNEPSRRVTKSTNFLSHLLTVTLSQERSKPRPAHQCYSGWPAIQCRALYLWPSATTAGGGSNVCWDWGPHCQ